MKSLGIYAGSFNPFHVGHLNILKKAQRMFDEVIIAQGHNSDKPLPPIPTRVITAGFERRLCNSLFLQYSDATTDLVKQFENGATRVTLIRGLRDANDFMQEIRQVRWMQAMYDDLNVCFIPCDPEYQHISSSDLRKVMQIKPALAEQYQ